MLFDAMATKWDTPVRVSRARAIAGQIRKALLGCPLDTALEFGSGTGLVSLLLADRFSHITLMDASSGMTDFARAKIARSGLHNLNAVTHDLEAEPWPEPYDCIFSSMSVHHVRATGLLAGRFYEMLCRGGVLCIVDLDLDAGLYHAKDPDFDGHHGFDHDAILSTMDRAGFRDLRIRTFYHGEKRIGVTMLPYSLFCLTGTKSP